MKISEIKITKLFGLDTFTIKEEQIKDNKLILVSENGGGKSTILKIVYYFLSKQWNELAKINFEKIEVTIDEQKYEYKKSDYKKIKIDKIIENVISSDDFIMNRKIYKKIFHNIKFEDLNKLKEDKNLFDRNEQDEQIILIRNFEIIITTIFEKINEDFGEIYNFQTIPLLYLPTYRRTESDFHDVFYDPEKILWAQLKKANKTDENIIELSEYGIDDINEIIYIYLKKLSKATSSKKIKLIAIINDYITVCQKYLEETKNISYNETLNKIEFKLNKNDNKIEVKDLSAGEKQIISIFSYLYLIEKIYFIIFDEPELSISIFWQEELLEDIEKSNNLGFVVATHSPYIFKKNNMQNVFSLNDFK